jgi:FtsH-binding integral membrane protein
MAFSNAYAPSAAGASSSARASFIRKTYLHLAGAVLAFLALEAALLGSPLGQAIARSLLGTRFGWLLVLGGFMLVGVVAQRWAASPRSVGLQYAGLALYVVADAIIFVPLLYVAAALAGPGIIAQAGLYTLLLFTGLTGTVVFTRRDFSWLRTGLMIAGFAALALIVVSMLFGFQLGTLFIAAMVALAAGYILYDTSNVLHHYPPGAHVAAALSLFASVALLFWYVLQLLLSLSRRE